MELSSKGTSARERKSVFLTWNDPSTISLAPLFSCTSSPILRTPGVLNNQECSGGKTLHRNGSLQEEVQIISFFSLLWKLYSGVRKRHLLRAGSRLPVLLVSTSSTVLPRTLLHQPCKHRPGGNFFIQTSWDMKESQRKRSRTTHSHQVVGDDSNPLPQADLLLPSLSSSPYCCTNSSSSATFLRVQGGALLHFGC